MRSYEKMLYYKSIMFNYVALVAKLAAIIRIYDPRICSIPDGNLLSPWYLIILINAGLILAPQGTYGQAEEVPWL